ncbi:hypothetical protein LJR290_007468 [Variovorax sp. LjRoot290]|uniref:hypothetical protein n=1 Tax=Variovorax sp. LjRoot290 TaxID=3342316 RepID=UPI003ECF2492
MTNDQYTVFEAAAKPSMQQAMAAIYAELQRLGVECDTPSDIDHDVERGIGIEIHHPGAECAIGVEFMLTDGDARAFTAEQREPECGLLLSVIGPGGVFLGDWSPYNYSDEVGTTDPEEIVRRVGLMTPVDLARSIHERILDWAARESDRAEAPHA